MSEKPNHPPERTWLIANAAVGVGVIGVSVYSQLHYAEWKASVSSTFIIQNDKTDEAIAILHSRTLRSAFSGYFLFLLGTIPFLVSFLRPRQLWISVLCLFFLMIPIHWYAGKVSYVASKFVDWKQIYPEWSPDSSVDLPNASAERPKTDTQQ